MQHTLIHTGHFMEHRLGFFGFIWTWLSYVASIFLINEQFLREVSLVMAILVSFATLVWYIGQFIINWKKFQQGRRDFLNEIKQIVKRKGK